MQNHIRIKTDTDEYVHFDTGINDYTLCGLETAGDEGGKFGINLQAGTPTLSRVNCPACIRIFQYCRNILLSEIVRTKING